MKIGIPAEIRTGEARVSLVPAMVGELSGLGAEILVERGAGSRAHFADGQYQQAGARLVADARALYGESDVVIKIHPPEHNRALDAHEVELIRKGGTLVGLLAPFARPELVERYLERRLTAFSLELVPRITRAQGMDVLSSMATVAGYRAVLVGAQHLGKLFPLLMTAAGTIPPANVLVIGAGVAGLQAIATAKRLGARVEAFDTRPAVQEQVESLGARFVEMELAPGAETAGGYAKEMTEEFIRREREAIGSRLPRTDLVVTTAQVFGKPAPMLLTEEMVAKMPEGAVIVDLAAEGGGNCALTRPDEVVREHGVTVLGPTNLPATVAVHASQMYSRNVVNLVKHLFPQAELVPGLKDDIARSTCVCRDGELVSPLVQKALKGEGAGS